MYSFQGRGVLIDRTYYYAILAERGLLLECTYRGSALKMSLNNGISEYSKTYFNGLKNSFVYS